jgi:hypothetical protein
MEDFEKKLKARTQKIKDKLSEVLPKVQKLAEETVELSKKFEKFAEEHHQEKAQKIKKILG